MKGVRYDHSHSSDKYLCVLALSSFINFTWNLLLPNIPKGFSVHKVITDIGRFIFTTESFLVIGIKCHTKPTEIYVRTQHVLIGFLHFKNIEDFNA